MSNLLDISIHGPQRVAIVEELVHVCRYNPGAVLLEGDAGKSPVNFLRHMADLLRDEMDFALLDAEHFDVPRIAAELVSQWYIYKVGDDSQTDTQSVHHYLDLGLQSGRLALVVVERASLLTDEATNFLVSMMARHSRLTVLFAGMVDPRPLVRRAQQAEVPVHRIDLPDAPAPAKPVAGFASGFDHTFSDVSYELPDDEGEEDELYEQDFLTAEPRERRGAAAYHGADSLLGGGTAPYVSTARAWGAATLAGITRKRPASSVALLVAGCLVLAILLVLIVRYSGDQNTGSVDAVGEPSAVLVPVAEVVTPSPPSPSTLALPMPVSSPPVATIDEHAEKPAQPVPQPVVVPASPVATTPTPSSPVQQQPSSAHTQLPPDAPPVSVSKSAISNKAEASKAEKAGASTEKSWRAKPGNYTVQVAAAHGEANIRRLEARLPTGQPHFLYRTTRDGKPWFVLVYGSFPGKQAAVAARDALGADIKKDTSPWVRKQGEIFAQ